MDVLMDSFLCLAFIILGVFDIGRALKNYDEKHYNMAGWNIMSAIIMIMLVIGLMFELF